MSGLDLDCFLAALPERPDLSRAEGEELREKLQAQLRVAAKAWPARKPEPKILLPYWAEKVGTTETFESLLQGVDVLPVADLFLASDCCAGDSSAIADFEALYFPAIAPALAKLGLNHFRDEVCQHVCEQLFVKSDAHPRPRIAELAGNGALGALVKVMAVRSALGMKRRDKRLAPQGEEALIQILSDTEGPASLVIKSEQQVEFKAAFEFALRSLDQRSRAVLRLHLLHRLNISQIAELYDVHRATTARWLGQVRDDLGRHTRQRLRDRLNLDASRLESLMQAVQSQIEISFERVLAESQASSS